MGPYVAGSSALSSSSSPPLEVKINQKPTTNVSGNQLHVPSKLPRTAAFSVGFATARPQSFGAVKCLVVSQLRVTFHLKFHLKLLKSLPKTSGGLGICCRPGIPQRLSPAWQGGPAEGASGNAVTAAPAERSLRVLE